jgi:enoyl-CoA hydratase/carnithine racemase
VTETSSSLVAATPSEPCILVETLSTGAAVIWLNRPSRLNALGVEMVSEIVKGVNRAVDEGATALVLRARGRSFCTGADLKERRTMNEEQRYAHNRGINAAVNALATAPVPTIAVIHGMAMGGGLELALGCDLRIVAESAQLGLTEARIGAIPGAGGTQRLPRLVGISQALYMMYVGDTVPGRRAHEIGLINECVPDEELEEAVSRYVDLLGSRSPFAARTLKAVVHEGMSMSLEEGLERERLALSAILGSADYAEGLAAFAERRRPRFSR